MPYSTTAQQLDLLEQIHLLTPKRAPHGERQTFQNLKANGWIYYGTDGRWHPTVAGHDMLKRCLIAMERAQ